MRLENAVEVLCAHHGIAASEGGHFRRSAFPAALDVPATDVERSSSLPTWATLALAAGK
jgi:hypothetical protein